MRILRAILRSSGGAPTSNGGQHRLAPTVPSSYFGYAAAIVAERWARLEALFAATQPRPGRALSRSSGAVVSVVLAGEPSKPFAWLRCTCRPTIAPLGSGRSDRAAAPLVQAALPPSLCDCAGWLRSAGGMLAGRGEDYGSPDTAERSFARIVVTQDQSTFDLTLRQLQKALRSLTIQIE